MNNHKPNPRILKHHEYITKILTEIRNTEERGYPLEEMEKEGDGETTEIGRRIEA